MKISKIYIDEYKTKFKNFFWKRFTKRRKNFMMRATRKKGRLFGSIECACTLG